MPFGALDKLSKSYFGSATPQRGVWQRMHCLALLKKSGGPVRPGAHVGDICTKCLDPPSISSTAHFCPPPVLHASWGQREQLKKGLLCDIKDITRIGNLHGPRLCFSQQVPNLGSTSKHSPQTAQHQHYLLAGCSATHTHLKDP